MLYFTQEKHFLRFRILLFSPMDIQTFAGVAKPPEIGAAAAAAVAVLQLEGLILTRVVAALSEFFYLV